MREVMRRAMNITPAAAERSRHRVQAAFDKVAGLLADGRPFLVGARLSAADVSFASLAAPVIAPPEYGGPLPPLADFPREAVDGIMAFRDHPAGRFALRVYREHRR
jgi:glutathione S-transferase